MRNLNTIAIEGRLSANAEVKAIPNTERICLSFTIAVNSPTRQEGKVVDYANFIECKYYVKEDKVSGYLTKGTKLCVQGEIRQDRWEGQNGEKRSRVYVLANFISFSGRKNNSGDSAPSTANNTKPVADVPSPEDFDDKDVPF